MVLDILDLYPDLGEDLKKRFNDLVKTANEKGLTAPERESIDALLSEMANAYTKSTGGDYARIMRDAERIIEPLTKEDHEHSRQLVREYYAILLKEMKNMFEQGSVKTAFTSFDRVLSALKKTDDLYSDAFSFICSNLRQQFKALEYYGLEREALLLKVEEKAAEWYEMPEDWAQQEGEPQDLETRQKLTTKRLPPKVIAREVLGIDYPIDKVNGNIWNLLEGAPKNGQIAIRFNMAKHNSGKTANVLYSIDFNDLGPEVRITKQLTPFDKRVMISAAALFNAGNEIVSTTQIYEKMGNTGKPSAKAIEKINDSLTKLRAAHVYITNEWGEDQERTLGQSEKDTYRKAAVFKYDGSLLPMERMSAYINGQLTESAIKLFREPPLVSFARSRGQITKVTTKLLQSPVNKTDLNLMIDDYLIDRISKMKNAIKGKKHTVTKILFSTINESCKRTTSKQRQRTAETVYKYLDYYQKVGFIKGYSKEPDGVNISP